MEMTPLFFDGLVRRRIDFMSRGIDPRNNGYIKIHDSSISIWEETVDDEDMLSEVLGPLVNLMRRWGWTVRSDQRIKKHYRILNKYHRHCRRGQLEAKLSISGRHLEIKFFQNVANVSNPHGGEHEFDILARMPYLLRLQTIWFISKAAAHLHASHGYRLSDKQGGSKDIGPRGSTAMQFIEHNYAQSWHLDKTLGYPSGSDASYNNKSADGGIVTHGMQVWIRDSKGRRWLRGTAYYNINNMWWVVTGPYSIRNIASFDISIHQPANLRDRRNQRVRRSALEKQMLKAIATMDFHRAETLRQKLFGNQPLFRIWHKEKQAWYGTQNCGYSCDTSRAGLYTRDEAERSANAHEFLEIKGAAA
ncbi:hypothetical protein [Thalassospira lohafexi]|uniref:Uncharacterized protein n=1 Tax=Thalassospira lohafexi TaxID=744227 RepID=A0A2N3L456_9PROT|nr:hypothetical protein [Thalassospira lohafexi]PKR57470.1 hypothetical protein COO92_16140 [Thalassospira lohafexi]